MTFDRHTCHAGSILVTFKRQDHRLKFKVMEENVHFLAVDARYESAASYLHAYTI